jgi:multimeric flavodoxin WrbA
MPTVLVVYHSAHGHTRHQAEAVTRGAASVPGVTARALGVEEAPAQWQALHDADALIFGCPTYMGSASAEFKQFMDATSAFWSDQLWRDKIAAGFTNAGGLSGDKYATLIQLVTFAAQHSMIWVTQGVLTAPESAGDQIDRLGSWLGSMSQSPRGQRKPEDSDLATAHAFGARVAQATVRWARGKSQ